MKRLDLRGQQFRSLTAVRYVSTTAGVAMWLCRCACGKEIIASARNLRSGNTGSCGCSANRHGTAHPNSTHGMAGLHIAPEYRVWTNMKTRCFNQGNRQFANYGARGITVCDRWRDSFESFLADMGRCPPGLTLDRINNDGNYEPGNCRWATRQQQARNRRSTRLTMAAMSEVSSLLDSGVGSRKIARRFGVTRGAIQNIAKKKRRGA